MAKYSNTVEYNIRTTLDSSGIVKLQTELSKMENQFRTMRNQGLVGKKETTEALANIELIRNSLNKAFNGRLGMLDTKAFLSNLTAGGKSLSGIAQSFSAIGAQGTAAFTRMYGQISRIDTGLKQVSSASDKIMNTLGNTVRWGLIASAFAGVMNSIHQSVEYVKDLDKSLTNIMMVSGETRTNMNAFAKEANQIAQRLGGTTTQMTEATKIFVQQGLSLEQSSKLAEYSVHLANVSEQDSAVAADEITAYKNAFKIDLDDLGNAISKWAAVANNAAVSVEELSVASQKAASVAKTVGVDMDQFAAHIAAIESTTREAPENIGNGLKTLYSRISDIKLGETLEDGVNLGQFTGALKKIGVDALDASGQIRNAGEIIEDIMVRWKDLSQTERVATATTVAGRFQLARFNALMNSADIYQNALNTSRAETGTETYDRMQDTYRESLAGRMNALTAAIEEIFLNAFETDDFYSLVDASTALVKAFGDLIEAVGGGSNAFTALAAFLTKTFSTQIGRGISNFITNRQSSALAESNKAAVAAQSRMAMYGLSTGNAYADRFVQTSAAVNQHATMFNPEQIRLVNEELAKYEEQVIATNAAEKELETMSKGVGAALAQLGMSTDLAEKEALELMQSLKGTEGDLEKAKGLLENSGFLKLADQAHNAQTSLVQFRDSLVGISAESEADWGKIQGGAKKLQIELMKLKKEMKASGADTSQLSKAITQLSLMVDGNVKDMTQFEAILRKSGDDINSFREGIIKTFEGCEKLDESLEELIARFFNLKAGVDATDQKLKGMAAGFNIQFMATQVTNLASAFMSLSFVMMSVRSLIDIFNNEDMDPFEKFEQVLMNVSMIAVMGIPMIGQFRTAIIELSNGLFAYTQKQILATAATEIDSAAKTKNLTLTEQEILAESMAAAKRQGAALTAYQAAAAEGTLTKEKIAQIVATNGLTLADLAAIAAHEGLGVAVKMLTATLLSSPLAPWVAGIMAAATAIALIIKIIQTAEENYRRFDTAVEESKERMKQLAAEIKEAKEQVSELSDALNKLKEGEDPFKGLTEGTQEWNQALIEANNYVLDLLEKYPALAAYVTRGKHGELTFTEKGMEQYYNESQLALAQAYGAAARGKLNQGVAQNNQTAVNTLRTKDFVDFRSNFNKLEVDNQGNTYSAYDENTALAKFQEAAIYAADHIGDSTDEWKEELAKQGIVEEETIEKLARLGTTLEANTTAVQSATAAYASSALSTSNKYQELSSTGKSYIDEQLTAALSDTNLTYSNKNEYVRAAVSKFDQNMSWDDQSLQNWYAQKHGYTYDKKENRFYDSNNNQVKGLDYDNLYKELREAYIAEAIVEQFQEKAADIAAPLEKALKDVTNSAGEDIASIFKGNGKIDVNALTSLMTESGEIDLSQLAGLSQEDFKSLGFEDANAFVVALQETLNGKEITKEIKVTAGNSTTDFSDDEIKSALENSDLSEAGFNRMSQTYYEEDSYFQRQIKELPSQINEANKALNALGERTEENAKEFDKAKAKVQKLQAAYDGLEKEAKDTAAANVRLNKGVKTLTENWEDLSTVLQDDAMKGTSEWYEALAQLDESMSDILNIDIGTLSNDFYKNADAMQAMADIASGDLETAAAGIDKLRDLASQDIIAHMEIQPIDGLDIEKTRSELLAMQQSLQATLDNTPLEARADVDVSEYTNKLNEMIAAGQITAEQASQALSSMGISGDVTYIDAEGQAPVVEYQVEGSIEDVIKNGGSFRMTSSVVDYRPVPMKVPQFTGTHYTGPGIRSLSPGSVGGGSKSGGGGGGGGKSNEPKSVSKSADIEESKPAEAENDIYEKVNATLEKLQDSYSKLNKIKDRTWGKEYRDNAQKGLDLLVKEQKTLDKRIDIAKKYADALTTGKSNLEYGIDMTGKESLASLGLTDADADGVVDNYIPKFEEARQAARKLDEEAEAYRKKANAEALAYWQSKGGVLDAEGNVVTEASMSEEENKYYTELIEKQKTHYDLLVEKANKQWEIAGNINDVTKDYEDTMNQIRDDGEKQLDIAHQIEDIQIDLYQRSLDMLDTMHDINDIAAQMKGFFTKLATDDPFRALTEGAQAFENSFKDATYNAEEYYDDIIDKLKQEQDQVRANGGDWEKYNEAIAFYDDQKQKALTDADGLGSGELAQASRKLTELDRWIRNPNAVDNPYGTNTQALYDAYKEQYQKVTDAALEAEERMENVHDSILEAYDKMAEQQDELTQEYDRIDKQLERTSDRVGLFKGEDAYADQAAIEEQRAKVALAAGRSSLKILSKYRQQLAKAEEEQEKTRASRVAAAQKEVNRLQKALNEDKNNADLQQQLATAKIVLEQAKYNDTEEVKALKNHVNETADYINDKADESAEHFKNAYENTIDELAAQTNEKIFGNRDLDLVTNDWDWDKDYFDSYKDNVERTLETEKLRLKYLDLLDDAQGMSLGVQRQIKDAMDDQLALLENQKTVSEYDVKLANARLEILQKQIALENAQQNKNQMKLRRDTQGNYKYVYAADQGDVRQKQQELLDAEFDAYEMSKDANGDAYQKGIALYQQYIEQRTAIEKKYANDTDTMEKELAKLRENYLRAAEANAEDLQDTYDGMIISVQWMAENGTEAVKQMTEDVLDALETKTQESLEAVGIPWNDTLANGISDLENLQTTVDNTAQAGIDAAKRFVDAIDGDAKDINDDLGSVKSMTNDLAKSIDGDAAAVQKSFGDIEASIGKAKQSTMELGVETDQLNQKLGAELGAVDEAKKKIALYEKQLNAAKESTSALASQLAATQEQLSSQTKETEKWKTTYEDYKQSIADKEAEEKRKKEEANKAADKKTNTKKTGSKNFGIGDTVYYDGKSAGYYTSYKDTPNWTWHNDAGWYEVFNMNNGMTALSTNDGADLWAWVENEHLTKYKTGGYTGIWEGGLDADDGRLAVLHQKELVLNQQDTKNILDAVQIVRSTLDLAKLSSLNSSTFGVGKVSQGMGDRIEQRVEITAEFPAANSADDIRQALLSLSDAAMQYAYRER